MPPVGDCAPDVTTVTHMRLLIHPAFSVCCLRSRRPTGSRATPGTLEVPMRRPGRTTLRVRGGRLVAAVAVAATVVGVASATHPASAAPPAAPAAASLAVAADGHPARD